MSEDLRGSPLVCDHVVHLFYTADGLSSPPEASAVADTLHCLGDVAAQPEAGRWVMADWGEALADASYAARPLWERHAARGVLSRDLLPNVRDLLSGQDERRAVRYHIPEASWGPIAQLLKGSGLSTGSKTRRLRYDLTLDLSASPRSLERIRRFEGCADIQRVRLKIGRPTLFNFRSDIAILDLPLEIELFDRTPPRAAVLVEAVKSLARTNKLCWIDANGETASEPFSLGCIARSLLEGPAAKIDAKRRIKTCTYAQFGSDAPAEDVAKTCLQLANHFTDDYDVGDDAADAMRLPSLGPVEKVTATSGSCIAVHLPEDAPEALWKYRSVAFECAYAPLTLLALHEQAALTALAMRANIWPEFSPETRRTELAALESMRTRADQVRLAYGFASVSLLSEHERWRAATESSMRLPTLRARLTEDLVSIQSAVRSTQEAAQALDHAQRRRRFILLESAGGGALAAVALFSVLKDVLAPSFSYRDAAGQIVPGTIVLPGGWIEMATAPFAAMVISLIVGLLCAMWLLRRERALALED